MVLLLFIVSIGVVLYTYGIYPLIVAAIGFLRPGVVRKDEGFLPAVTLIISAYNEQDVIDAKLKNSLALDYPNLDIIVGSESTDGTNEIASKYADQGIVVRQFSERRGKSATLFRIVPTLRSDIVVFSDANAMYRPDTLRKMVRNFADPSVGCVIGQLKYRDPSESVGGRGEAVYWKHDEWHRRHAAKATCLIPGINGSVFAIRRELYFPVDEQRGDDYELCTRIAIRGHAVVFEADAIAEEAGGQTTRQQFNRKTRLVRWNIFSSIVLIREALLFRNLRVAWQVLSHRLLRYTVPVWLLLALGASAWLASTMLVFRWLLACQLGFYAFGLVGWSADAGRIRLPKLWLLPAYFVMVNSAAMVGILELSRGQMATWQKQR